METSKTAETPESKLHFLDYWRIIRLRKTVILIVFLLVVLTTTVVTMFLPPTFASMARIAVEKDMPDVAGIDNRPVHTVYDPFYLQTEFERIQSQSVLYKVIEKLDLNARWTKEFELDRPLATQETFLILKKRINVKQSRNTSLIEIWVYSRSKTEAADLANEIAEVYREERLAQREQVRRRAIEALRDEMRLKDEEIKSQQEIVNAMRREHNIPDLLDLNPLGQGHLLHTETIRQLEAERGRAQAEYDQINTLLVQLLKLPRNELRYTIVRAYQDQILSSLLTEYAQAEQRLSGLLQHYSPEHPDVKQVQEVVSTIDRQINENVDGILSGLHTRVAGAKARWDTIEGQVQDAKQKDIELAAIYRPYFDAKRELDDMHQVRRALNLRIEQERIEVSLPHSTVVVVTDQAEAAVRPVRPNIPLNIALGIMVGLIVGVGLAFFIEYLDTSIKTIDDVERALQAPVLAVIPQNVKVLLEEGPESPHAEAYRVLRTNILFSRKGEGANTVTVVSGGAGEGKSTTLFNLATVFAQNGSRVLVVDSDLRRPSIHKMLKISNAIGLTNYLLKQNTLEEVIQTTGVPTLDFLPSGKLPSSSMGILSSSKMKELIAELKKRYDFVFFDSPPLLGVSDASILASEVDLVLQVIQYRRYPQPMTIRAKQMIQKVGGNLVGIVLNNINVSQDENYYYYSGYYYDYYSKHDDDDAVKKPKSEKKQAKELAQADIKSKF